MAGSIFLVAAAAHRKGYLAKITKGPLSDPELQDCRAIMTGGKNVVHQGYRTFDPVSPNLADHPYAKQQDTLAAVASDAVFGLPARTRSGSTTYGWSKRSLPW